MSADLTTEAVEECGTLPWVDLTVGEFHDEVESVGSLSHPAHPPQLTTGKKLNQSVLERLVHEYGLQDELVDVDPQDDADGEK